MDADVICKLVRTDGGFVLSIPRRGVGFGTLAGFAAGAWLLYLVVGVIRTAGLGNLSFTGVIFLLAVYTILLGINAAFFLFPIHFAFRRAAFVADGHSLAFVQSGPLGKSEKHWPRGEIGDVDSVFYRRRNTQGDSHAAIRLLTPAGEQLALVLHGRSRRDAEYIASRLRAGLGVPDIKGGVLSGHK